jgi:predicted nuclease with RNAse H fold
LCVIGVDLAGSPRRITGLCYLNQDLWVEVSRAYLDDEILSFINNHEARVIAIDAPLSLPRSGGLRRCDKELRGVGIRVLPPVLGGMRRLTERAIRLREVLASKGHEVIEVFPTGARKILGLPSRRMGVDALRNALLSYGVRGLPDDVDQHILDAVICALVGLYYLRGEYMVFGDDVEGMIVMPRPRSLE